LAVNVAVIVENGIAACHALPEVILYRQVQLSDYLGASANAVTRRRVHAINDNCNPVQPGPSLAKQHCCCRTASHEQQAAPVSTATCCGNTVLHQHQVKPSNI
jgi:hypothetical protein